MADEIGYFEKFDFLDAEQSVILGRISSVALV